MKLARRDRLTTQFYWGFCWGRKRRDQMAALEQEDRARQEAMRKLIGQFNPPTGITVEDRQGEGLWLSRDTQAWQVPFETGELVQYPVIVAAAAPVAVALIRKSRQLEGTAAALAFSRLVKILLPTTDKPLEQAVVQPIPDAVDDPDLSNVVELERISDDGNRMLLRRSKRTVTLYGSRWNSYTYRFDLQSGQCELIEP